MIKASGFRKALVILLVLAAGVAAADELPEGAVILDEDLGMYSWPYPTISPNGKWVAYVSQGYVCVCDVKKSTPRRIMEVPNSGTWPHFVIFVNNSPTTGTFDQLMRGLERDEYNKLLTQKYRTIYGFTWTFDSEVFVFGVQSYDAKLKQSSSDTYFAGVDGECTRIASVRPASLTEGIITGIPTRDRKFVVSSKYEMVSERHRPLIWNIKTNKPRATPFLFLIPSSTSDRWLGIEKDTRQLVVVDKRFEVIKRFEESVPEETYGFSLDWSPDERFVIWRNQIGFDHFSNWEGFRLDLETGAKRMLDGRVMDEKLGFTGHGGEFYRCGNHAVKTRGYDKMVGSHLTLVPDGDGDELDLWRLESKNEPAMGTLVTWGNLTPIRMTADGELFALSMRKWVNQKDYSFWELIDRAGKRWQQRGKDGKQFLAPYVIAGFADNGRLLVAHDETRLFTFPVSIVKTDANKIE